MHTQFRSPNFDERKDAPIDMIVLHYTDMVSTKAAIDHLCKNESKVSAHYVVGEDGEVYQLVEESMRAWHAGESFWRGHSNINSRSIGIEIAIPQRNIVGHSDVAFLRKMDPGELFDWPRLARAAIGIFPVGAHPMMGSGLERGDNGKKVIRLQTALNNWGYGLKLDGDYGVKTEQCVIAFQRHYRPMNCDGKWDDECAGLLAALHGLV